MMDTISDSTVPQFVVGPGCPLRVMSLGSTGLGCSDGRKASLQFWSHSLHAATDMRTLPCVYRMWENDFF